ncbi:MAG TPA: FliA/WhiG family RNA polymerase sigma factor [Edaphobacter sp.]|nr:FliA/WhiG family RNA polymerase sigma factor [Edaphobacter sp.]
MGLGAYGCLPAIDETVASQREALVLAHLPQVRFIAKRIHDRLPSHISLDDLISTGVVGLLSAIDNFDPSQNVQLNTYAERRIRGAIMDSLREMDWAPREIRRRSRHIEGAIHKLKQKLGSEPSEEQIAAELQISLDEYQKWLADVQLIELARLEYSDGEEQGNLLNVISDDEEAWPSRIVERSELERILALAIERMPKVERTVLSLYYYQELSLREIAEVMDCHLSRVGQLRVQAILRLRSHLQRVWLSQPGRKA